MMAWDGMTLSTLFFAHAGGSSHNARELASSFERLALRPIDYPGHGRRVREPLLGDLERIADDALAASEPFAQASDYALFGHSMGARVAFLVGLRLAARGLPPPRVIVVSGTGAPGTGEREPIHHLPEEAFLDEVAKLGGLPEAVRNEPLMRELFIPILRADFRAVDTWSAPAEAKLEVPLVILHGREDEVREEDARAWSARTTAPCRFAQLEGGHFFLYDHPRRAAKVVERLLRELSRETDRSTAR